MRAKSFLFVAAWMQPLKALPLEQRWNVIEAIMEYSIFGEVTMPLDLMETIAFGFIRNEIDRMKGYHADRRKTRRAAAKSRWTKEKGGTDKPEETVSSDANDANVCKAEQGDAPYYILSESKSESKSESESESEKKSSSTSYVRARVRGGAGKICHRKVWHNPIFYCIFVECSVYWHGYFMLCLATIICMFLQNALYFNYFTVFLTIRKQFKQPYFLNMCKTRTLCALGLILLAGIGEGVYGQLPRQTINVSEEQLESYPEGKYDATWESLEANYSVPEWFKDAKFGIFIHWGPYTVPAYGSEWYPKHMYNALSEAHREKWGKQTEFGYKDFIPMFKAENFNADEWAELFKASGAQYVIPTAEHHDGFAMYDSDLTEWTSVKHGPKRDVIGELAEAVRGKGMKFGISNHRVENWDFMYPSLDPDSTDLFDPQFASLYGPPQKPVECSGMGPSEEHPGPHPQNDAFLNEWQYRVMEIIDKYHPDLIYFDNGINYRSMDPWKLRIARYYYNSAQNWGKEVSLQSKSDAYKAGTIRDFERESRAPKENVGYYWQVDDPIGHKFGYVEDLKLQKADNIISNLINNISRNGNLCLNISPKSDGTIPEDQKNELYAIGKWLSKYGEAVYGTRAYGPNKDGDVRYTCKGRRNIYAFIMKWDGKAMELPGIKASDIESISCIGGGKLSWEEKDGRVIVATPDPADDGPATVLRIKLKSDLTALFIGDSITDGGWGRSGGSATPSSKRNHSDQNHALGHSYVMLAAAKMMSENPELKCNWLNRGISGNTIKDLKKRWREDMIDEDPDVLTVMVGINDVYMHYRRKGVEDFDVEGWEQEYRNLLEEAKANNPSLKIVLMSPFISEGKSVDPVLYNRLKQSIDQCAEVVEKLSKEFKAEYIDTHGLFNSLNSGKENNTRWIWDGVHPTPAGHQMIANLWTERAKKKKLIQ